MAGIQDVYDQFDPMEALEPGDPRYVDSFAVRGVPEMAAKMLLPISPSKPTTQFLSGHLGDGKTTFLKRLAQDMEEKEHFVAYGEVDHWIDLADLDYEDVLLGVLVTVDDALRLHYKENFDVGLFRQVFERVSNIAQAPVDVKVGISGLTTTLHDVPDKRIQVRSLLRGARGPSFLDVVNEYLDRAREMVQGRGRKSLVVVLDNLDRVPEKIGGDHIYPDERLLLGYAAQLARLRCNLIGVLRLGLAYSQASNLQVRFGELPRIIPMIPPRRRDGRADKAGMAKLREILEARLRPLGLDLEEAFVEEGQDLLCRRSGGHLRELMSLVRQACAVALSTHGNLPLELVDAEAAVRDHGHVRKKVAIEHADALESVRETLDMSGVDADERPLLINKRLVYEYRDGDGYWYGVAPLAA